MVWMVGLAALVSAWAVLFYPKICGKDGQPARHLVFCQGQCGLVLLREEKEKHPKDK